MGRVCGIRVLGCPGRPSEFVVSESVGTPPGRLASFELKSGWVGGLGGGCITATLARAEICVSQLQRMFWCNRKCTLRFSWGTAVAQMTAGCECASWLVFGSRHGCLHCVYAYIHVCMYTCVCVLGRPCPVPTPIFYYLTWHFILFTWVCSNVFPTTLLEWTCGFVVVLKWIHVSEEFAGQCRTRSLGLWGAPYIQMGWVGCSFQDGDELPGHHCSCPECPFTSSESQPPVLTVVLCL